MKKMALWLAFAALTGGALRAQDITGTWQGTLKAGRDLRTVLKISKDDERLKATMYSIEPHDPVGVWDTGEADCRRAGVAGHR